MGPDPLTAQVLAQAAQEQARQRALAARTGAGRILYDQAGIPPPPAMQPPVQPSPPPGSMSPGGGNPMAPPGASTMAPPGIAPPPPVAGPRPIAAPGGMTRTGMPPQIPPFRPLPTQPPAQAAPGMVPPPPPPPAAAQPGDGTVQPRPFDLKSMLMAMKKAGVPPDKAMDMLDELSPVMSAENKQELEMYKASNAAMKAANEAYARVMTALASDRRAKTGERAEDRRGDQGQQRIDIKKRELEAKLHGAIGGAGGLKTTEYIYPRGPDGRPDTTKEPIGVRGVTKTGKIVNLDAEGHQVPTLAGASVKEGAASKVKVTDTVRSNIVRAGVTNTLRRLDELEQKYPGMATSSFFGQHGDNPLTRKLYGTARGTMSGKQQEVDAQWASIIDEAIPVFTGGLRGSDAFRRFLIEQAPGPGDKPETIRQKIDLIRKNVEGTSHAFFDKFSSDPTMWATGTTKEQVEAAKAGNSPGGTSGAVPAGVPAGAKVIGKTPGGADVYEAPDGKRYTAD